MFLRQSLSSRSQSPSSRKAGIEIIVFINYHVMAPVAFLTEGGD